jgi:hypothetical protein
MLDEVPVGGWTVCEADWESKAMKRFLSHFRRSKLARPMYEPASSLLPTPTASPYGSSNNGLRPDGKEYRLKGNPSLWTRAARAGGRLSPNYVEVMMGFPKDWTVPDGERSGTPSSPKSPKSSDTSS